MRRNNATRRLASALYGGNRPPHQPMYTAGGGGLRVEIISYGKVHVMTLSEIILSALRR